MLEVGTEIMGNAQRIVAKSDHEQSAMGDPRGKKEEILNEKRKCVHQWYAREEGRDYDV